MSHKLLTFPPLGQVGHEQGQWAPGCPGRCVSRYWGSMIFEIICDSIMPMHFCLHSKFTSNLRYHQSEPRMSKNECICDHGHSYILTQGSSGWSYACSERWNSFTVLNSKYMPTFEFQRAPGLIQLEICLSWEMPSSIHLLSTLLLYSGNRLHLQLYFVYLRIRLKLFMLPRLTFFVLLLCFPPFASLCSPRLRPSLHAEN